MSPRNLGKTRLLEREENETIIRKRKKIPSEKIVPLLSTWLRTNNLNFTCLLHPLDMLAVSTALKKIDKSLTLSPHR